MTPHFVGLNLASTFHHWATNIISHDATVAKIKSFDALNEGWHYGSGRPASTDAVIMALRIYRVLTSLGLQETDAFPGIDGEIQVTAYHGEHYFEVVIEDNGTLSVRHEWRGRVLTNASGLNEEQAKRGLEIAVGGIWNLSDLSTLITMIRGGDDSSVLPSRTHPMALAYQLFPLTASETVKSPSANTYMNITATRRAFPQFSWNLTQQFSQATMKSNKLTLSPGINAITM